MIQIRYGSGATFIDVTEAVFRLCFDGELIRIPPGDILRAELFSDPAYGVVKQILVTRGGPGGETREAYDADTEVVLIPTETERSVFRPVVPGYPTRIASLAIAITFFFRLDRLQYLRRITAAHRDLADDSATFIVTNTSDPEELDIIRAAVPARRLEIITPTHMGHPYLLAWGHREVFRKCLETGGFSHYLYTEDDLLVTRDNIDYWLRGMADLAPYDCIPAFFRYEVDHDRQQVSTDVFRRLEYHKLPKVRTGRRFMVSLPWPYQGMYLLSERHARDLIFTEAGSPDYGLLEWGVRERAAQGLTFYKVPHWAYSRYLVGLTEDRAVDPGALVHHLPNNYALQPSNGYGEIPVGEIFTR